MIFQKKNQKTRYDQNNSYEITINGYQAEKID